MARTKAVLGAGARLSDYLSASLLARVYPAERIEQILDEHGVNSQRVRDFPALSVAYYCIALSLYPEAAYEEVFNVVSQGLGWMQGAGPAPAPLSSSPRPTLAKSSISAARARVGVNALVALHARSCLPLTNAVDHPHAFYGGRRLVAIDGSHFEVPDEAANAAEFGYPGSRSNASGHAGYPQAQCAVLVECASHAILSAQIGPYRQSECALCEPLLAGLDASMLCLADRGFDSYEHWRAASLTQAALLWRCKATRLLPVVKTLSDGSYLSVIYPGKLRDAARRRREGELTVRVIDYRLPGTAAQTQTQGQPRYRLITTLLDPIACPALELAALYHERWEVELVFDELKTHLGARRRALRSKTPEGVRQEFYGWVLAHYAVCWLMHAAAGKARLQQRRLSFTGNLQLLRRAQPRSGDFPPSAAPT